jgi:hypothetical protein
VFTAIDLREAEIKHWKFRVALELILQLQPSIRLTGAGSVLQLFVGEALLADGFVSAEMFASDAALRGSNLWRVKFAFTTPTVPPLSRMLGLTVKEYTEQYGNPSWTCPVSWRQLESRCWGGPYVNFGSASLVVSHLIDKSSAASEEDGRAAS